MRLDLGLCLKGHTKWVGDFSTLVGVYKDGNKLFLGVMRETTILAVKVPGLV